MKTIIIDITSFTGHDLKSRAAVRHFRDILFNQQKENIKIDFRNVKFASRSFMDEFYNVFLLNSGNNIKLLNISPEIQAMLDAVKATQHRTKHFSSSINAGKVVRFRTIKEVNKYLNTLSVL